MRRERYSLLFLLFWVLFLFFPFDFVVSQEVDSEFEQDVRLNLQSGQLGRGETLVSALRREGIHGDSIREALHSIGELVDLRRMSRSGDRYEFSVDSSRKMVLLRYYRGEVVYETVRQGDAYVSHRVEEGSGAVRDGADVGVYDEGNVDEPGPALDMGHLEADLRLREQSSPDDEFRGSEVIEGDEDKERGVDIGQSLTESGVVEDESFQERVGDLGVREGEVVLLDGTQSLNGMSLGDDVERVGAESIFDLKWGLIVVVLLVVSLVGIFILFGLFFVSRFLLSRRLSGMGLELLEVLSLGFRHRIVLVRSGDSCIVLGISGDRMTVLTVLESVTEGESLMWKFKRDSFWRRMAGVV